MKFDKQNMVKNRFWIGLGAFGFFFFIAFAILAFGDAIGNAKKDYDTVSKDLKSSSNPKHVPTYVPPWQDHTKAYKAHKEKAWEQAWDYQKNLLTWPEDGLRERWAKGGAKDFKGWVASQQEDAARLKADLTNFRSEYKNQFKKLDQVVVPAEFHGGLVGFEQLMAPVGGGEGGMGMGGKGGIGPPQGGIPASGGRPGADSSGRNIVNLWSQTLPPNLEEAWIAQEDFAVKRELLLAIGAAIKSAARLEPGPAGFWQSVGTDDTPTSEEVKRYRCHNNHWELDLLLKKTGPNGSWVLVRTESTLRNVDLDRRPLNVSSTKDERNPDSMLQFRVLRQSDKGDRSVLLEIQSETLAWGASIKLSTPRKVDPNNPAPPKANDPPEEMPFVAPDDIKEIDQVLDWESSPIRIIEDLRIGCAPALGQRLADIPLKAGFGFEKREEDKPATPPQTNAGSSPSNPSGSNASGSGPRSVGGPPGGPGGAAAMTVSATDINRLDRNRYLHVTEQSRHLPFGMALIIEKNQVPEILAALANTPLKVQLIQIDVQRVRGVSASRAATRQTQSSVNTRDDDANLVELVVYGICTLYERVPEKSDKPKQ
jgi:hypothetical protein